MRWNGEKAALKLYRLGNLVVRVTGSIIFVYLTRYSFRYTQYMLPFGKEIPVDILDSRTRNVLGLALAAGVMALLLFLEKRLDRKIQKIICRISAAVAMLWIAAAGLWWTYSSAHIPVGDQAFLYGGASYFIEGDLGFLSTGAYDGMYPHQLGLTALCELLFRIVGTYNYRAFEVICIVLAAGSAYLGYRLLMEITESMAVIVGYNILMLGCLPLILYTPWVYGDIPSIFFALLAAWMLLRYASKKKIQYSAGVIIAMALAMLVRKNSAILLVAMGLAVLLYALLHRDKGIVLTFLLAAMLSFGSYEAIFKMYEIRSGLEHSKGIPNVTWVTMGLMENQGAYGWYNNYPKEIYYKTECDREETAAIARQDMRDRLEVFRNDTSYAYAFFRGKVLSQWNQPLYQALYFNAEDSGKEGGPAADSLAARLGGEYYLKVLALCDRWQFLVYAGVLCYFLLAVRRDSNILQHVLMIAVIGGFFFSILWEAKARYIFPYYVMMFPFAAYGYGQAASAFMNLIKKGLRKLKNRKGGLREV